MADQINETMASQEARPEQGFDALLKERDFQSEFDRRVSRALETARGKWARETERRIEQARAEAEARARMTGEERMAHDFAQREAQLNAREQEIMGRELRAEAARMIQERGLPMELVNAMNYSSAEDMAQSLNSVGDAFMAAVQVGVEQRMRGSAPVSTRRKVPETASDADYYRANYVPGKRI